MTTTTTMITSTVTMLLLCNGSLKGVNLKEAEIHEVLLLYKSFQKERR